MTNKYLEIKEMHQEEVNNLPILFAFGNKQMDERAKEYGFKNVYEFIKNIKQIGAGAFVLKKDYDFVVETFKKQADEMKKLIDLDDEFLKDAFEYELSNHEYIITYDITDTLRALGISYQEFGNSKRMQKLMEMAKENYLKEMEKLGW